MSEADVSPVSDVSQERQQAVRTRDALYRLIDKLQGDEPATPSELTVWIRKSGPKVSCLFLWMACTAVAEKYQAIGKQDIAAKLHALRDAAEQAWPQQGSRLANRDHFEACVSSLRELTREWKRISQHQSRWICPDMDIVLCAGAAFHLDYGITPWICQQADLRYRWTADSMRRLDYLAACWDAYARKELAWEDRMIGLSDFPTHPEYC